VFHFPRANTPSVEIRCDELLRLLSGAAVARRNRA